MFVLEFNLIFSYILMFYFIKCMAHPMYSDTQILLVKISKSVSLKEKIL